MGPKMGLLVSSDCPRLAFEALHHGVMGLLGLADPALQYAVEEVGACPTKSDGNPMGSNSEMIYK